MCLQSPVKTFASYKDCMINDEWTTEYSVSSRRVRSAETHARLWTHLQKIINVESLASLDG